MSLQETPRGERFHIVLFGKRNAGKSSLLNAVTGQQTAIVSEVPGTTTDPVSKAMEILPIGPCMLVDTPGLDDEGELGKKRVEKTVQMMHTADLAVVVIDIVKLKEASGLSDRGLPEKETELLSMLEKEGIPCLLVLNQVDRMEPSDALDIRERLLLLNPDVQMEIVLASALKKTGIEEVKQALIRLRPKERGERWIVRDLVRPGEMVVLVVPIDSAAPKGRLILPQQQVLRELLDYHAVAVVTQTGELPGILERLSGRIRLVITDSQAFREVDRIVPPEIYLTSFSILFARYKGDLERLTEGVRALETLKDGDKVLIAEGCTHHRQCEDIGTVKIPGLLRKYTGREIVIETSSGTEFPENLSDYAMVIHCGGCTLPEKEMKRRLSCAGKERVSIVNYGIFLSYVNGILMRSTKVFEDSERIGESES